MKEIFSAESLPLDIQNDLQEMVAVLLITL